MLPTGPVLPLSTERAHLMTYCKAQKRERERDRERTWTRADTRLRRNITEQCH